MLRQLSYLHGIKVASSKSGRGVFATEEIPPQTLIEIAPIIAIPAKQWPKVSKTLLTEYFFEMKDGQAGLALGYTSLYNHSFEPTAEYEIRGERILMTTCDTTIKKGQEIFIDYGWDYNEFYQRGIITRAELLAAFLAALLEEEEDEDI